ncbi:MAG: tetratricopeptide repeat protein [Bacteroidetes bacterium]|nr:tetratricopeptide repeat protein [Bacteroidota bacterium]MBU1114379.1 tetratricopeptide repeat protein [Bacteroidota bacterium]MBU1798326.1 tetratricopeptide repeat protein [Bacteroidota bacterium]
MFKKTIITFLLFLISSFSLAQEKTFIREYTHTVGDADSKITSRAIALNQVKKILLEEIGVYIESTFEMETTETNKEIKELTNNQIISITAGITETKILDEIWDGSKFYIKAEITLDIDSVKNKLGEIAKDRDKTKQLEEANNRANLASDELSRIREQLNKTITEKEKLALQLEYAKTSDELSASDWFQKAYNAYEMKEYDNTILYYQKAIDLDPNNATANYNMGIAYSAKEKYDKAIECYQKAIDLDPNDASAYNNMGYAYFNSGNVDKAIECYQRTIDLDPNEASAYILMGLAYSIKGNYDKAIECYQRAIKLDTNNIIAYLSLGLSYSFKGNYDKSIECYQKVIELDPNNAIAYDKLQEIYAKRTDKLTSTDWFQKGYNAQELGELDNAILYYQKAIELNPNYVDAYYNMGNAYGKNDNADKAIECYQKVIEIAPNYTDAYLYMGLAYGTEGDFDEAIMCFKKVIELDPNNASAYLDMGLVYGSEGDFDEAIRCIKKSIRLGSKEAQEVLNAYRNR